LAQGILCWWLIVPEEVPRRRYGPGWGTSRYRLKHAARLRDVWRRRQWMRAEPESTELIVIQCRKSSVAETERRRRPRPVDSPFIDAVFGDTIGRPFEPRSTDRPRIVRQRREPEVLGAAGSNRAADKRLCFHRKSLHAMWSFGHGLHTHCIA